MFTISFLDFPYLYTAPHPNMPFPDEDIYLRLQVTISHLIFSYLISSVSFEILSSLNSHFFLWVFTDLPSTFLQYCVLMLTYGWWKSLNISNYVMARKFVSLDQLYLNSVVSLHCVPRTFGLVLHQGYVYKTSSYGIDLLCDS